MLNQFYDDNATIKANKMPSSLVEVPKINEKYEMSSYQQFLFQKLKSEQLITNSKKDPILNTNAAFFNNNNLDYQLRKTFTDPYS
jgi:hypothetical protein